MEEPKPAEELQGRMTLGEHLDELRSRLIKSLAALGAGVTLAMVFYDRMVAFVAQPHFEAMKLLGIPEDQSRFLAQDYTAPLVAVLKLALLVGTFVASPVIGYQVWAFVRAGLYRKERRHLVGFAPASFVLFVAGCAFGYFVLVPYCLYGLARTFDIKIVAPTYGFSEYLGLVTTLTVILGAVFQLPLFMAFFARIGLVKPSAYNKWRRAAIIGNLIFAAVITPADIFTMIVVAVPLLLLYEIGVVAAVLAAPRPAGGTHGG